MKKFKLNIDYYNEKYVKFLTKFIENLSESPNQRKGQVAFNTLYKLFPEVANKIRGTEIDPFYDDNKLDKFFSFVYKELEGVKNDN